MIVDGRSRRAGVDFVDNRIKAGPAWLELKPTTPFGSLPTLELPGKGTFAQSNAIIMRWFKSGSVDHVPATVFDAFPKLTRLFHAVADHPGVKSWQARS